MNLESKKKLAKFVLGGFIIFDLLLLMIAIPSGAQASGECTFVPQHGWHIVGGGQQSDHWFESYDACMAALYPPTAEPTETDLPTEEPTLEPTTIPTETNVVPTPTYIPTDDPTVVPTETLLPTPTYIPTDLPTNEPTEPPVVTGTPSGENPTPVATALPAKRGLTCSQAWDKITGTIYERETGFRFFNNPNHAYCQVWLLLRKGVNWNVYQVQHPLGE